MAPETLVCGSGAVTIADEVDAQLTQTMGSYMKLSNSPKTPKLAFAGTAA